MYRVNPTRRDFLKILGLGAASAVLPKCLNATNAKRISKKPNIVFILADDLGFKDVGYQGGDIKTPHIDKLAREGTRLDQFYVQPVCSPTRSSLMTGRYPIRCGLQIGVVRPWAKHGLPLEERTLAEALKEAGYTTAICGKWHLGHLSSQYLPTSRGFDHQYGHYNGALDYFTHIRDGGLDWHRNDRPLRQEGYSTDLIADESVRIIKEHNISRPLFLYVPFNAVHSPFQATQPYIDMYKHITNKRRRIYSAMVTSMDDAIGRIVKALQERGLKRNTLIIFCSDNGGVQGVADNGPLRGHKAQLYEGGIRVPAVALWPDVIKAGAVVKEPLHIVDMYPTLIKLAGARLEQPLPIDGKDAWPTITDGKPSPHEEILHNVTAAAGAIRRGDWKLVYNGSIGANNTGPVDKKVFELFNIADDPYEKSNLADKYPQKFQELKLRLEHYAKEAVPANIPPNKMPKDFKVPKVWGHPE
ncbi:MAG: sulfatase-like hydrolase/transferase [Planctomycetes bacterium]|nr:sulfatase-like hydrolase/transferase [Planctomycetota bacterium]MBL7146723.1 sulfatase-like hydrolase/transferase [Phycisphaerae bacterium]